MSPFDSLQVQMVKMADLRQHLPQDCLPQHLGGLLVLDACGWNRQLLAGQNGCVDPVDELVGLPPRNVSIHTPGSDAMNLAELAAHVARVQRVGIYQEYEDIRKEMPSGTFHCALWVHMLTAKTSDSISGFKQWLCSVIIRAVILDLMDWRAEGEWLQATGLAAEFILSAAKRFCPCRTPMNQERNRYGDVLCLDQSRVHLKPRMGEVRLTQTKKDSQ